MRTRAHWANIAPLRHAVEQHHFERSEKHHIAIGDASFKNTYALIYLRKCDIILKECSETEGWLKPLFNTYIIDEETFKNDRNLCGRVRRMLIASCETLKINT